MQCGRAVKFQFLSRFSLFSVCLKMPRKESSSFDIAGLQYINVATAAVQSEYKRGAGVVTGQSLILEFPLEGCGNQNSVSLNAKAFATEKGQD